MNHSYYNKLSDYNLSEEEVEELRNAIDREEDLQAFDHYRFAKMVSHEVFIPGYSQLLQSKGNAFKSALEFEERLVQKKKFRLKVLSLIILSIFCLSAYYFIFHNKNVDKNLYASLTNQADSSINLEETYTLQRSKSDTNKDEIPILFKEKKYKELIENIEQNETSSLLLLLKARALIHESKYDESITILNKLYHSNFNQKDAILWSLIEAHLSLGHKLMAKDYLNELIVFKYPKYELAKSLYKNI